MEGIGSREPSYLVADSITGFQVETIPQQRGGFRYAVGQLLNPKTIVFQPGGLYKDQCVISGSVATVSSDFDAVELYKLFVRKIKKTFTRINAYWLGPDALKLFDGGTPLSPYFPVVDEYRLKRTEDNSYW